jgi:hypothetical protein
MGGAATRFMSNPGSWFAHQRDEYGTGITGVEVYPAGTELRPAGPEGAGFAMTEPIRPGISRSASRSLRNGSQRSRSAKAGSAIAASRRRRLPCVVEVWIENTRMIELLPPAFATEYLTLTRRCGVRPA